jgi:hypothetical protein
MRILSTLAIFLCWISLTMAQQTAGSDYILVIDGIEQELALGTETKVKLKSGAEVPVLLKRREFGRFTSGDLSFEFPGKLTVATSPVDDNSTQHLVATATGTIMLVQIHKKAFSTALLDDVYNRMMEEPKALGIPIEKTELRRTIANNQVLEGVRGKYKGGDDDVTIDITLTQVGSGSFLVLTMHDKYTTPEEGEMVERFWKSLTLKK